MIIKYADLIAALLVFSVLLVGVSGWLVWAVGLGLLGIMWVSGRVNRGV